MAKTTLSINQVKHIAELANLPISDARAEQLQETLAQSLDVISNLQELDVSNTPQTHQVTETENVWRDDVVDTERMFSQAQALANAPKIHEGYFVVNQVISQD